MTDIKIGDFVEVTKDRNYETENEGRRGIVLEVDDDSIPYLVDVEGDRVWVMEVRKLDAVSDREVHVTRAKELLTGTPHSVDDIIRVARFLAGE
jgi:hypothetical protein